MNRFGNPGERRGGERRRGSAFHVGAHASSLALILASLVGCGKGPAPATPVDDAAPPTNPAPAPLATTPADGEKRISVSDVQLAKDFEADRGAAAKNYNDQTVVVKGRVLLTGPAALVLRGTYNLRTNKGTQISCSVGEAAVPKLKVLLKGQTVAVRGKCVVGDQAVLLLDAEPIEVGPDPTIKVSAVELSRAYAKNAAAADEVYAEMPLLVEGIVVETHELKGEANEMALTLAGFDEKQAKPYRVWVGILKREANEKAPAPGDTVKARGLCTGLLPGENGPPLVSLAEPQLVR